MGTVHIFTMPLEFPCGPDNECCGPIGQSDEEVESLKEALANGLDVAVEVFNVKNGQEMKNHREVLGLLRNFGWGVLPIISIDGDVVSMGLPTPEQAVEAVREKLGQA